MFFSEFLGHFLLHSCYLDKEIFFFFANLNCPLSESPSGTKEKKKKMSHLTRDFMNSG